MEYKTDTWPDGEVEPDFVGPEAYQILETFL